MPCSWCVLCPLHVLFHHPPEFAQAHVHSVGDAIQPSHPLSSPSPFAFNLFQHQDLFQWVSASHQVAKVLELQLQHQSFQSGVRMATEWISFRIDSFGLLAIQVTLKSLLQHRSLKPSILCCSAFFIVQLSHLYMTTGKTVASFPHSQSLSSGSLQKPLVLIHQRADKMKTIITEN